MTQRPCAINIQGLGRLAPPFRYRPPPSSPRQPLIKHPTLAIVILGFPLTVLPSSRSRASTGPRHVFYIRGGRREEGAIRHPSLATCRRDVHSPTMSLHLQSDTGVTIAACLCDSRLIVCSMFTASSTRLSLSSSLCLSLSLFF